MRFNRIIFFCVKKSTLFQETKFNKIGQFTKPLRFVYMSLKLHLYYINCELVKPLLTILCTYRGRKK